MNNNKQSSSDYIRAIDQAITLVVTLVVTVAFSLAVVAAFAVILRWSA